MSRTPQLQRLNLAALAQEGQPLSGQTDLSDLARLAADVPANAPAVPPVAWTALAQWRARPGAGDQLWLHLQAQAQVPLTCQRCLAPAVEPVEVDRWFRFVETEDQADAEDEDSQEDLLVMAPQFDLSALLEDELIMSLPLVPLHDQCPQPPVLQFGEEAVAEPVHPFAALAQLRKPGGS